MKYDPLTDISINTLANWQINQPTIFRITASYYNVPNTILFSCFITPYNSNEFLFAKISKKNVNTGALIANPNCFIDLSL